MWKRVVTLMLLGLAGCLVGCGEDPPASPPDPVQEADGEPAPAPADHPGLDPRIVREFEEAPVPPPVPWAGSGIRRAAIQEGAFDGLPEARDAEMPALLRAFQEVRDAAAAHPGSMVTGPFGGDYEPSREELRLAEVGERIRQLLLDRLAGPPEAIREGFEKAGIESQDLVYRSFREITVKAFGSGYAVVVEPEERRIVVPSGGAMAEALRRGQRVQSMNNLRSLALLLVERSITRGWPSFGGKGFVLSLVANKSVDLRNPTNLELFFSSGNPERTLVKATPERFREVTKEALRSGTDFHELTSYAGRRNDDPEYLLTPDQLKRVVPILADLSFADVALVAFSDGSVKELTREDLGLEPADEIVVGDASKSDLLRGLSDD